MLDVVKKMLQDDGMMGEKGCVVWEGEIEGMKIVNGGRGMGGLQHASAGICAVFPYPPQIAIGLEKGSIKAMLEAVF